MLFLAFIVITHLMLFVAIVCVNPPTVEHASNGYPHTGSWFSGDTLMYQCEDGWTHAGGATITECLNGAWTHIDIECMGMLL